MQKAALSHWPAAWRGTEEHDDRAFKEEAVNCHSEGQHLSRSEQDVNDGRWCEDGKREEGMGRMEEMRARMEREAAWRAATSGQEVVRRGQFWLG